MRFKNEHLNYIMIACSYLVISNQKLSELKVSKQAFTLILHYI